MNLDVSSNSVASLHLFLTPPPLQSHLTNALLSAAQVFLVLADKLRMRLGPTITVTNRGCFVGWVNSTLFSTSVFGFWGREFFAAE